MIIMILLPKWFFATYIHHQMSFFWKWLFRLGTRRDSCGNIILFLRKVPNRPFASSSQKPIYFLLMSTNYVHPQKLSINRIILLKIELSTTFPLIRRKRLRRGRPTKVLKMAHTFCRPCCCLYKSCWLISCVHLVPFLCLHFWSV